MSYHPVWPKRNASPGDTFPALAINASLNRNWCFCGPPNAQHQQRRQAPSTTCYRQPAISCLIDLRTRSFGDVTPRYSISKPDAFYRVDLFLLEAENSVCSLPLIFS